MAEKSQKPLSYFFTRRKQCEDESAKESTTMQVAHEELNDVDDPTKNIATKAKRKFQPRWLKSNSWLDYDQENTSKKCSLCAVLVILKSSPRLIGKERGIQNMFTSHSGNTNFKLERV